MGPVPSVRRGRLSAGALGRAGEDAAASLLRDRGFEVVGRGFLARRGELDVVCRRGAELFIFEVKARSRTDYGTPAQAVGRNKRRTLRAAAHEYRLLAGWRGPIRFGIVGLIVAPDGTVIDADVLEEPF
jgi:putative endonuclease